MNYEEERSCALILAQHPPDPTIGTLRLFFGGLYLTLFAYAILEFILYHFVRFLN